MQGTTTETESSAIPTGDQKPSVAAHMPTPWKVGDRLPYCEIWGPMQMNSTPILASMESGPREANAEFIVRAVNSHSAISEALRTAVALLMVEAADHDENQVFDRKRRKQIAKLLRDFIHRAYAALDQGTASVAHGNHVEQAPAVEAKES